MKILIDGFIAGKRVKWKLVLFSDDNHGTLGRNVMVKIAVKAECEVHL
jgi:hypothetical protein